MAPPPFRLGWAPNYVFDQPAFERINRASRLATSSPAVAAHMTPPFMAQGMAQGLRDAQNLACKLRLVLDHQSADSLLDTCAEERLPHVRERTLTAIGLGRVICQRDADRARQRDLQLLAEQGATIRTAFRQIMIPDLKNGLIAADTPGAGRLFPQPNVRTESFSGRLDDRSTRQLRLWHRRLANGRCCVATPAHRRPACPDLSAPQRT